MKSDNIYMRRALELASLARGYTESNPMVGAVIVHDGRIIGEGYHHRYGEAHAEVRALESVAYEDKPLLRQSTVYVSLEPCAHYGKTPPCATRLIREGVARVVVAQLDPYPEVSGRGVAMLREAGIEVELGCCEAEARELNKAFNRRYELSRPYVLLKWAESADGYLDAIRPLGEGVPIIFSSPYRQRIVHRTRRDYQAILIGAKTAVQDNPSLTNRYWGKKQPIRIVLDRRLSLPQGLKLFTDGQAPTWVLYDSRLGRAIERQDTEWLEYCPLELDEGREIEQILGYLADRGINSVFVEGGGKTLQMFVDADLYDEIRYERSPIVLGDGVPAPRVIPSEN